MCKAAVMSLRNRNADDMEYGDDFDVQDEQFGDIEHADVGAEATDAEPVSSKIFQRTLAVEITASLDKLAANPSKVGAVRSGVSQSSEVGER